MYPQCARNRPGVCISICCGERVVGCWRGMWNAHVYNTSLSRTWTRLYTLLYTIDSLNCTSVHAVYTVYSMGYGIYCTVLAYSSTVLISVFEENPKLLGNRRLDCTEHGPYYGWQLRPGQGRRPDPCYSVLPAPPRRQEATEGQSPTRIHRGLRRYFLVSHLTGVSENWADEEA